MRGSQAPCGAGGRSACRQQRSELPSSNRIRAARRMTVVAAQAHGSAAAGPAAASTVPRPCPVDFSRVKGVLFDIDGTLTNSDPLHFRAFQEILVELDFNGGVPIEESFFRAHISGRHNPEIAADLFPAWPEERRTQFYMDKEARYRRLAASTLEPLAGLMDFLAWADEQRLRKAAVTNAPRENAELMLRGLDLEPRFEHLVLGEECARAKPHPDPYQTAMQLLGLAPAECLVVEDSPSGVAAGVAAGVPVIGLLTGQPEATLREAGACWIVSDFQDILAAALEQQRSAS